MNRYAWMALGMWTLTTASLAEEPSSRIAELEAQVRQLQAENQRLRERLDSTEAARVDLESDRARLERLAGVTAGGEQVESRLARIQAAYDDAADRTTVSSAAERIEGPGGLQWAEHRIALSYSFPGRTLTPEHLPGQITLEILALANTDDRYKLLRNVTLVVDGESFDLPVARYRTVRTQPRRTSARMTSPAKSAALYDQQVTLMLDRDLFNRMGDAQEASIILFSTRFTLSRENLATFVALRERLALSAQAQP